MKLMIFHAARMCSSKRVTLQELREIVAAYIGPLIGASCLSKLSIDSTASSAQCQRPDAASAEILNREPSKVIAAGSHHLTGRSCE